MKRIEQHLIGAYLFVHIVVIMPFVVLSLDCGDLTLQEYTRIGAALAVAAPRLRGDITVWNAGRLARNAVRHKQFAHGPPLPERCAFLETDAGSELVTFLSRARLDEHLLDELPANGWRLLKSDADRYVYANGSGERMTLVVADDLFGLVTRIRFE